MTAPLGAAVPVSHSWAAAEMGRSAIVECTCDCDARFAVRSVSQLISLDLVMLTSTFLRRSPRVLVLCCFGYFKALAKGEIESSPFGPNVPRHARPLDCGSYSPSRGQVAWCPRTARRRERRSGRCLRSSRPGHPAQRMQGGLSPAHGPEVDKVLVKGSNDSDSSTTSS